jgi:hypothetical protein
MRRRIESGKVSCLSLFSVIFTYKHEIHPFVNIHQVPLLIDCPEKGWQQRDSKMMTRMLMYIERRWWFRYTFFCICIAVMTHTSKGIAGDGWAKEVLITSRMTWRLDSRQISIGVVCRITVVLEIKSPGFRIYSRSFVSQRINFLLLYIQELAKRIDWLAALVYDKWTCWPRVSFIFCFVKNKEKKYIKAMENISSRA